MLVTRHGLCCGGRMFVEENVGKRINAERAEEALAIGRRFLAAVEGEMVVSFWFVCHGSADVADHN